MRSYELRPIDDPLLEGERITFYAPELDYRFVGTMRGDHWPYEANMLHDRSAAEAIGVSHWAHLLAKPFRGQDCQPVKGGLSI